MHRRPRPRVHGLLGGLELLCSMNVVLAAGCLSLVLSLSGDSVSYPLAYKYSPVLLELARADGFCLLEAESLIGARAGGRAREGGRAALQEHQPSAGLREHQPKTKRAGEEPHALPHRPTALAVWHINWSHRVIRKGSGMPTPRSWENSNSWALSQTNCIIDFRFGACISCLFFFF